MRGYFEDEIFIKTGENTMMGQDHGKQRLLMHEGMVHYIELETQKDAVVNTTDVQTMVDILA